MTDDTTSRLSTDRWQRLIDRQKQAGCVQTIVWWSSLAVSFALTAWQFSNCFGRYLDQPTGTDVTIKVFSTYKSPKVTLCPFMGTIDLHIKFYELCAHDDTCKTLNDTDKMNYPLGKLNTSLVKLWNEWRPPKYNITAECWQAVDKNKCRQNKYLTTTLVDTIRGRCHDVDTDLFMNFGGGEWNWILVSEDTEQKFPYQVKMHSLKKVQKAQGPGLAVKNPCTNSVILTMTEFKRLNSRSNPCWSDVEEINCLDKCADKVFHNFPVKCRLPFLDSHLPYCDTISQIDHVLRAIYELDFYSSCSCKRICNYYHYSEMVIPWDCGLVNYTSMGIMFASSTKQVVSEFFLYPFSTFVSDVGGNVGVFLGISLFSILIGIQPTVQKALGKTTQGHEGALQAN